MAVATKAIVEGSVLAISKKSGVSKKSGEAYEMIEVLIIGEFCLANCTLDKGVKLPEVGQKVRARVEVSVYGGEDQTRLLGWL